MKKTKKATAQSQSDGKEHAATSTLAHTEFYKTKKVKPAPRLSNHKKRAVWFRSRVTWPLREAPTNTLIAERNRARSDLAPEPGAELWECVGPTNIGGRMTSVICHPVTPEHIWAGAAGGGVWESLDAGRTWRAIWDMRRILNVGSLAIDLKNPDVIYCGTGEANLSADSYPGVGLYKTEDGGKTWHLLANSTTTGIPTRIGAIAVDPFDSSHLLLGGVSHSLGHDDNDKGGLYESSDGGVTWKRYEFVSRFNYWCHSIAFHPSKRGTIFATVTEQGARSGIWRSKDRGKHWEQLTTGLPHPAAFGRTSIAIAPSNTDVLYAFATDDFSGNRDHLLGVFRSSNGGDTWKNIAGTHFKSEDQISYGNAIAVHPTDPNYVICGGVDLHLTTDAGKTWRKVTKWDAARGSSRYAHSDHHALVMPAAAPGRIYDANDGGLDVSDDGGGRWANRSNGLSITMFYDVDVAPSDGRSFGGGAQDNGTIVTTTGRADDFHEVSNGDGGWIVYGPDSADHIYTSDQFMGIYRHRPGGRWSTVSPPADEEELAPPLWMVFITMDPSDSKTVFTGSRRVWKTTNDAQTWKPVSDNLDGSPITAIEVAAADRRKVYVGTDSGGFFRSLDGGDTWSPNLAGATLPGRTITRLETSPLDAKLLFATVANFGHSHVFLSQDGGVTWEDVDKGRLPDVPHQAVVIQPDKPTTVYVCNDAGVYTSPDLGKTWRNLSGNLPNVPIVDLVIHTKDQTLSAATYGRSIWKISIK